MIRGVRKMLSFQTQAGVFQVDHSFSPARTTMEIIASVKLKKFFGSSPDGAPVELREVARGTNGR